MMARSSTDIDGLPQELRLLLRMLSTENGGEPLSAEAAPYEDIDWGRFQRLAMHHRVYPSLYAILKKAALPWVPQPLIQDLSREYKKNTFRMLRLTGEMERICALLADQGVRSIVLKGPPLARELYGDVSLRTSKDLDIMIPIDDVDKTDRLLTQLGYKCVDFVPNILNGWRWRQHHAGYDHPDLPINLEIHWRLSPGPSREPGFEELWERRRISEMTPTPIHYLGAEDSFLYLVTHGARHGWFRVRWLGDIDILACRHADEWAKIEALMDRYQARDMVGQSLYLISALWSTPLTPDMRRYSSGTKAQTLGRQALYFIREMVENPPPELERKHKQYLFSLKSFRQKILYALSFLYPYPKDVETLPLPKPVHFLYFPLRPFLWMWRKARKHAWT
ncbi:nucleotidyltransferase family protein [Cohnella faecalis]|uniref:Renal dipeptidase n=1 Tax=Cohnella faecalis TaxID=2315694 RepID=A0A398CSQ5_9BACL|nr:nucleotidyltransferase family protein [Cohnella faecalis]RIE03788.1 Renal dipeptidase [Cohnella faecalis]